MIERRSNRIALNFYESDMLNPTSELREVLFNQYTSIFLHPDSLVPPTFEESLEGAVALGEESSDMYQRQYENSKERALFQ